MISTHWPERLYRSFIINMPGFFSILWKLVEPMLAPTTRKKIRLLRKHVRRPGPALPNPPSHCLARPRLLPPALDATTEQCPRCCCRT